MTVATITLSRGAVAVVDDEDLDRLQGMGSWYFNGTYACKKVRGGRPSTVYMHRVVLDAPDGVEVDHVNGDHLDNRKANLRLVTRAQNQQNLCRARRDSTTGARGVSFDPTSPRRPWRACVWGGGRRLFGEAFATQAEAEAAVREARQRLMPYSVEVGT